MSQTTLLSGKNILITRPLGRETHLCNLIELAGGSIIHYPVLKIQAPSDLKIKQLITLRGQLHKFSIAIFVSPTAVEECKTYFPALPEHLQIASIGSKTTQALALQNIQADIEAPQHNTESLLLSPDLQTPALKGKRVLIFRGYGGRALLGDTLARRGAQVRYVEIYHREISPLPPLSEEQTSALDAVTTSSSEGLNNLITLMDDPSLLIGIPLIVPSERAATLARQHGFKTIIAAENATDEATLASLMKLFC